MALALERLAHDRDQGDLVVSLPATTSAFATANIFARASGYIERRNVDIGDHVKTGQLLATIVAPELDHQIAQAEATLAQLRSTLQQRKAALVADVLGEDGFARTLTQQDLDYLLE